MKISKRQLPPPLLLGKTTVTSEDSSSSIPFGESTDKPRKVHILTRRRGRRYPDVLIGMAADLGHGKPDMEKGIVPILAHAVAMSVRISRAGRDHRRFLTCEQGQLSEIFLRALCRKHSCVWLWAPDLYRTLLALGLFDNLGPGKTWILEVDREQEIKGTSQAQATHSPQGEGQATPGKAGAKKGWSGFAVLEGRVTILVIRLAGGGVLHCCDTGNIGLPAPPAAANSVRRRAVLVREQVENWIDWLRRNEMGTLQHTISAQAFYGFRCHLPEIPVMVHNHLPSLGLERAALHGGRCEAFTLGRVKGPIFQLDFASLYGWCAAYHDVPVLWNCYIQQFNDLKSRPGIGFIADVDLELKEPLAPYRDEKQQLLVFPIGRFRTTLCQPELELVYPFIRKVHAAAAYQMAPLFAVWAKRLWQSRLDARRANDADLERQLKLFAQVIYGKFGQQRIGWRRAPWPGAAGPWECWTHPNPATGAIEEWRALAGRTEMKFRGGETHDSCPAIAAWIASLARRRLWDTFNTVGRENVYYTDTDSLWVNQTGYARAIDAGLVMGETFGALRIIRRHSWVEFIGWKHYRTQWGLVAAGIGPGTAGEQIDSDTVFEAESATAAARLKRAPRPVSVRKAGARHDTYRHAQVIDGQVYPFVRSDW